MMDLKRTGDDAAAAPPVAIGLPVYNGERFLSQTIESILAQDFTDFTLLISDNASDDGTQEIAQDHAGRDPRIVYLRNDRNLGAAPNYNRLFDVSRSPWFKWASSNDLLAPDYLSTCLRVLDDAPDDVVVCYPQTAMIDEQGRVVSEFDDRLDLRSSSAAVRLGTFARRYNLCNPAFGLLRRSAVARTGRIRSYISSDVTFLAEMAMLGQFWEVDERLFYRRLHDTTSTTRSADRRSVAAWFDTTRPVGGRWSPQTRVFAGILAATWRPELDLPVHDRLSCAVAYSATWTWRRFRVHGGRLKGVVRRRLEGGVSAPAERTS